MTELVPFDRIEQIVGATRHATLHFGRAVSVEERFYILHSEECLDTRINLLDCPFSVALSFYGVNPDEFAGDTAVVLEVGDGGHLREVPST